MLKPEEWNVMPELVIGLERKLIENRSAIEAGLHKIANFLVQLPTRFNEALAVYSELCSRLHGLTGPLAQRGWFISGYFGLPEVTELAVQCGVVSDSELDNAVAAMYRSSLGEHTKDLIHDYPERAFAIGPAVDAHNRGEYALSVPLFFAQAEGICFSVLNKYIFTKGKAPGGIDENIQAAAVERITRSEEGNDEAGLQDVISMLIEIMWLPYVEPLTVAYSQKDREKHKYVGLNRNTIMHGLDLGYATEENSLKAFSLLSQIGALLSNIDRDDLRAGPSTG